MAKEMMEQTKNSILSQASQAMLSQANQQPQKRTSIVTLIGILKESPLRRLFFVM